MRIIKKSLKKSNLKSLLLLIFLFSSLAFCKLSDSYVFDSPLKEKQFAAIIHEIRCPVCQNQSLADSNAPLANDLRRVIYQQIQQGESIEQVKNYLVSRYGDFISFKPPFFRLTYSLWLSPFILLLITLLILLFKIKKFDVRVSAD